MNHESSSRRPDRIAGLMQRKLAQLIQHEIHDPRLPKWMTILDVKISKDLGNARVYFTVISDEPDEVVAVLNASAPFLRTALARTLSLRRVPKLSFVYDTSVEYGKQLSRLIDKANDGGDATD
ncbi:MAG: 30S ribosome-binding factor RbfA [Gammaproteobacteria bacterium]|nr:30S ribosome-binding factor RbfA [Gammaproteobacteria bacterium]